MADDVRDQIHKLIRLQGLETEIRNIRLVLDQVEERTDRLDAQLKEFADAVESGKGLLQELNKGYRALESELQTSQSRIDKSQEKLRAVKTNKEYQTMLQQIAGSKADASVIEDKILGILEQMDKLKSQLEQEKQKAILILTVLLQLELMVFRVCIIVQMVQLLIVGKEYYQKGIKTNARFTRQTLLLLLKFCNLFFYLLFNCFNISES